MAVQLTLTNIAVPSANPNRKFDFLTEATPVEQLRRIRGRQNRVLTPIKGLPRNVFQADLPDRIELAGRYARVEAGTNPFALLKTWSEGAFSLVLNWPDQGLDLAETRNWQVESVEEDHSEWMEATGQVINWKVMLVRNPTAALTIPPPVVPPPEELVPLRPLPTPTAITLSYPRLNGLYTGSVRMEWRYTNEDVDYFGWQTSRQGADPANEYTVPTPSTRAITIRFLDSTNQPDYYELSGVRMWAGSNNFRQASSQDSMWVYGFQPANLNLRDDMFDPPGQARPVPAILFTVAPELAALSNVVYEVLHWETAGGAPDPDMETWTDVSSLRSGLALSQRAIYHTDLSGTSGTQYTLVMRVRYTADPAMDAIVAHGSLVFTR